MFEVGKNVRNEHGEESKIIVSIEDGVTTIEKKSSSDDQLLELTTPEFEALWSLLNIIRNSA